LEERSGNAEVGRGRIGGCKGEPALGGWVQTSATGVFVGPSRYHDQLGNPARTHRISLTEVRVVSSVDNAGTKKKQHQTRPRGRKEKTLKFQYTPDLEGTAKKKNQKARG